MTSNIKIHEYDDLDSTRGTDFDETGLPEEAYNEIMDALNEYVGGL